MTEKNANILNTFFGSMNKAAGMDGIHTNILKALSEEMSLPLCMIFKKSLDQGVVPFHWRAANVIPLYKKVPKIFQVIIDQ